MVYEWLLPLIGDCSVIFQKCQVVSHKTAQHILGHDIYLLHRGITNTEYFGKQWSMYNDFLFPEGMVSTFKCF
jgi:hypothetical protein